MLYATIIFIVPSVLRSLQAEPIAGVEGDCQFPVFDFS